MIRLLKMTPSQKIPGRWYADFSNGEKLRVNVAIIADFSLRVGMDLEEGEFEALKDASGREAAKTRALNILGNRSLSRAEIEDRLIKKGESAESAAAAADWLEKTGLIDDGEYAGAIVRHYAGKGYGVQRIKEELYRRGVPREYWDAALSEMPEQEDALDDLIKRKLHGKAPDEQETKKLCGFLRRRGFSWDEIKAALSRMDVTGETYE